MVNGLITNGCPQNDLAGNGKFVSETNVFLNTGCSQSEFDGYGEVV